MDIMIQGPGEVVICFIDSTGRTRLQERLRCSGPATMGARRPIDLVATTRAGRVDLAPVLISRGEKQSVTFDQETPDAFTRRRCIEIGCGSKIVDEAVAGRTKLLRPGPARLTHRMLAAR
jgi:hypothetical protein